MAVMGPKRGDLEPALLLDIADAAGANLNDVVSWKVIGQRRGTTSILFTDAAPTTTVDPANTNKATVKHVWVAGETDVAGVILVEVEATWPGGKKQTFPNGGYISIRIYEDLG